MDLLGVGHELIVKLGGEPDEGYQVGEGVLVAVPDAANLYGLVRGPDQVWGPVVWGGADPVGQSVDLGEGQPAFLGLLHELDGGDLVSVIDEVLLPGLHDGPCTGGIDHAVGIQENIDADRVYDPVVGCPQLQDPLPQLGVRRQRLDRSVEQLLDGRLGVYCVCKHLGLGVGVNRVDQIPYKMTHRHTGDLVQLCPLTVCELQFQSGQA